MLFSLLLVYVDTKEVLMWIQDQPHAVHSVIADKEHLQQFVMTAMEDNTPVKIGVRKEHTSVKDAKHWSDVLDGEATQFQSCLETPDRPRITCSTGSCSVPLPRHYNAQEYYPNAGL